MNGIMHAPPVAMTGYDEAQRPIIDTGQLKRQPHETSTTDIKLLLDNVQGHVKKG